MPPGSLLWYNIYCRSICFCFTLYNFFRHGASPCDRKGRHEMQQIYTIPIKEHFGREGEARTKCPCPICSLYRMFEENELDIILGASMMEPDIRIKTNKLGFCRMHYDMMFVRKNRLGMALTLESHLDKLRREITDLPLTVPGTRARARIEELRGSCYVCERIEHNFSNLLENIVYLWDTEEEFREMFAKQDMLCLPHYADLLGTAKAKLSGKRYREFAKAAEAVVLPYFDKLSGDVSWFCKKFDYRYDKEPWYDSKDAVERAIKFLRSDMHNNEDKKD